MDFDVLRKAGMSEGEVKVYRALLNSGRCTINVIHERTGIERRNIYDIINKLIEKGLISYIAEHGKRTYRITHPGRIVAYLEEKEAGLQDLKAEMKEKLPSLIRVFESEKPVIGAEIYRGKDGIKAIFEDMLNYGENRFIGGGWYIVHQLPHYWAGYNRRRVERKVRWYNLVRQDYREKIPEKKLVSVRFLPEEFNGSPSVVFIYGNKIVNVLWAEEFFAFMIENRDIAENYRRYFDFLWKRSSSFVSGHR